MSHPNAWPERQDPARRLVLAGLENRPEAPGQGRLFCRLRSMAKRTICLARSSSVESGRTSTPTLGKGDRQIVLAPAGALGEPLPEPPVVGVDVELLARLRVLQNQGPDVGKLHLPRVVEPDGQHLVPLGQHARGARPSPAR